MILPYMYFSSVLPSPCQSKSIDLDLPRSISLCCLELEPPTPPRPYALSSARVWAMLPKADNPDLRSYREGLNITKGKVLPS